MSQHRNITDGPLSLTVDGVTTFVPAGGMVTIDDEFDCQITEQAAWAPAKKTAPAVEKTAAAETEGDK